MATQAEVDLLAQEANTIKENLVTAKTNIEERFALLEKVIGEQPKPVGEAVDLTGLKEAIAELGTPSQELEDLEPIAAAPESNSQANGAPGGSQPVAGDGTALPNTSDPDVAKTQQSQVAEDAARQNV